MDANDLLHLLAGTTLAATGALLLAWLLRRPLRAAFGVAAGYGIWALVPVAVIAVLLPAPTAPVALPAIAFVAVVQGAASAMPASAVEGAFAAGLLWAGGVLLMALRFVHQQRRFMRALGRLTLREDHLVQAQAVAGLPAAVGLLHPRIVVPADFAVRYSVEQQCLLQAHERMHIDRGDLHANAIAALLRCVFWFNPLVHLAARTFRHDQELACDQRVIARHPHARRAYGEAMFNTQLAAQPLPLGCHWLGFDRIGSHPLKERIAMLKQPVPSLSRWLAGSAVVAAMTVAAGTAAWAAQPASTAPSPIAASSTAAAPAESANVLPANVADPMPAPAYPATALAKHVGGKVVLLIDVDAQGKPVKVVVDSAQPPGVFDQASIDAAMRWKFQPAMENGRAVAARISVPVTFEPRRTKTPAAED